MSFLSEPVTLQSIFGKGRKIDTIKVQVIIGENTTDTLRITNQPVQVGAAIADHSYKEPTSLSMTAHFKDNGLISGLLNTFNGSGLSKIYQDLLDLQSKRSPFTVITPKRIYNSMLMTSLSQITDKATENILSVSMTFQQVILVNVSTVTIDRGSLKNPGSNGATQPAGNKSALLSLKEGVFGQ